MNFPPKNPIKHLNLRVKTTKNSPTTPKKLNKYTLATTIVAECKRLDTGVGPSMALGSQEQKTHKEDLVQALMHKKALPPKTKKQKSAKSLTRFVSRANADMPRAKKRPAKNPIKKYDINPITSHLVSTK